jgi:hypothetical protein
MTSPSPVNGRNQCLERLRCLVRSAQSNSFLPRVNNNTDSGDRFARTTDRFLVGVNKGAHDLAIIKNGLHEALLAFFDHFSTEQFPSHAWGNAGRLKTYVAESLGDVPDADNRRSNYRQ